MADGSYIAECHLCRVSGMLSVANKPFVLSVVMLNVVMLSVFMPSVIFLSVVAPCQDITAWPL